MDLKTDESSGLTNAGQSGCEDLALLYQPSVAIGPVVKRGFFVSGADLLAFRHRSVNSSVNNIKPREI